MKKSLRVIIFLFLSFLIVSCTKIYLEEPIDVIDNKSVYQNLIPFNTMINTITFEKFDNKEDSTTVEVPTELEFLYKGDSYIDSCCYLSFDANISLENYTLLVKYYRINQFVNNPDYHYIEKEKNENISNFSTNFNYNNNINILTNCIKRYDLYKKDEFQLISFIINEDDSVYILLLKDESENEGLYQIEQGFIIKSAKYEENSSKPSGSFSLNPDTEKFLANLNYNLSSNTFKGLELYAWLENNKWQLVLLPGTNRHKTVNELKEGLILNTTDMKILIDYYLEKDISISIILIEEPSTITSNDITSKWIIKNDELENALKIELEWK